MGRRLRTRVAVGMLMTGSLLLAACADPPATDVEDSGISTVSFRVWDEAAAGAYRESFDAFTASHRDIHVEIEVIGRSSYWSRLEADADAGSLPDIFWSDAAHMRHYADAGKLVNITEALDAEHDEWQPSVVELFTHEEQLWGVPQTWDAVVMYYNADLLDAAALDPTDLTWQLEPEPVETATPEPSDENAADENAADEAATDAPTSARASVAAREPDAEEPAPTETPVDPEEPTAPPEPVEPLTPRPRDTLLPAARALTLDVAGRSPGDEGFDPTSIVQYGLSVRRDLEAILLPFLGQGGAEFQAGNEFVFASPEGVGTFSYLADLVAEHVTPPLEQDGSTGDLDLFLDGRLAMFQAGSGHLREISESAGFRWRIAPVPAGPAGRVSLVDGVVAAARAGEDTSAATTVLGWLGSADGQLVLASQGIALPGALGATSAYVDYWARRGVNTSPFLDAAAGDHVLPPVGPAVPAGIEAALPLLGDALRGQLPVPEAVRAAQVAGNAVLDAA